MYFFVDVGGTNMRVARSEGKELSEVSVIPVPRLFDEAQVVISEYTKKYGDGDKNAICLGLPGVFDADKTMLLSAPHLPDWIGVPIKKLLNESTDFPVYLENDADLGALGEARVGAGKNYKIVAFVTVGTGVGGARVVDGKLDRSAFGFEPGHQVLVINERQGERSVFLDYLVGGFGVEKRYGQKREDITDANILAELERYLAIGLVNTILHWSPEVLVLGGSLIKNKNFSLENVAKIVSENLKIFPQVPKIVKGALGDEAGLFGALEFLKLKQFDNSVSI